MVYILPWYVKTAAALLMITLIIYGMIAAKAILVPFLFALIFAILLSPLCRKLESWKIPRVISALLSLLTGLLIFLAVILFFYSQMSGFVEDVDQIQGRLGEIVNDAKGVIEPYIDTDIGEFELNPVILIRENFDSLSKGIASAATTLTLAFIIPVYIVLLLMFRSFLKDFVIKSFVNEQERVKRLINKIKLVVQHYLLGMLKVIAILAVLNSVLLLALGVKHAIFFGVFAAMLNVIPFVGPLIGSILPIMYALLTTDSLWIPFFVLLGFYIIQLFESNLFTPSIVGSQVSLNPLITLLAIFIGAQIWGLVGMILFIPAGAVLKVIFDETDSLKPLGFLLGKAETQSGAKGKIAEKVQHLKEKIVDKEKPENGYQQ